MRISDWSSDVCSSDLVKLPDVDCRDHLLIPNLLARRSAYPMFQPVVLPRLQCGGTRQKILANHVRVLLFFSPPATEKRAFDRHAYRVLMPGSQKANGRSEERRVGHACVSTCISRCLPYI